MRACYDTENCEVYCEDCCDIEPETMEQECDSPQHCGDCGCPVDYSLTPDGVQYVIEHIVDGLNDWDESIVDNPGNWYHGSPHCAIVGDWAKELSSYGGITPAEKYVIDEYILRNDEAVKRSLRPQNKGGNG